MNFSTSWKSSTQARKQRKYQYQAPLHVKQNFVHVHLSPVLRKQYGTRAVQVRKGDKVKVMRGQHKAKEGKVERVRLRDAGIFIEGVTYIKNEGAQVPIRLAASNLMIIELDLEDVKRKRKLVGEKI